MSSEYIEIDLNKEQKVAILKYASFFIMDSNCKKDLVNKRKKWVRFKHSSIRDIMGELAYHFNRTKNDDIFYLLDELICHLESYE